MPDTIYDEPLPDIGKTIREAQADDPALRVVGVAEGPGIEEDALFFIPQFGLYICGGENLHQIRLREIADPNRYSAWTMDTGNKNILRIPNQNLHMTPQQQIAPPTPPRITFRKIPHE